MVATLTNWKGLAAIGGLLIVARSDGERTVLQKRYGSERIERVDMDQSDVEELTRLSDKTRLSPR